jgi:tRNA (guanosine-2'-O-)-methyltransferase
VAAALADEHVVIPMRGMVDSLNVSVANALILYEAARQREAAGLYDYSRLDPDEYAYTLFEWCYPDIARRCREQRVPYPKLDSDGYFNDNPLPKTAGLR